MVVIINTSVSLPLVVEALALVRRSVLLLLVVLVVFVVVLNLKSELFAVLTMDEFLLFVAVRMC